MALVDAIHALGLVTRRGGVGALSECCWSSCLCGEAAPTRQRARIVGCAVHERARECPPGDAALLKSSSGRAALAGFGRGVPSVSGVAPSSRRARCGFPASFSLSPIRPPRTLPPVVCVVARGARCAPLRNKCRPLYLHAHFDSFRRKRSVVLESRLCLVFDAPPSRLLVPLNVSLIVPKLVTQL